MNSFKYNKTVFSFTTLSILATLSVPNAAQAEPLVSDKGSGGKHECPAGARPSDEQLEKLRALRDQAAIASASKHAELRALKHRMQDVLAQPTIDKQEATNIQAKMTALRADLSQIHFNTMLASADVFTPEQRKLMHSRMLHHGKFQHHGPPHVRFMHRPGGPFGSPRGGSPEGGPVGFLPDGPPPGFGADFAGGIGFDPEGAPESELALLTDEPPGDIGFVQGRVVFQRMAPFPPPPAFITGDDSVIDLRTPQHVRVEPKNHKPTD